MADKNTQDLSMHQTLGMRITQQQIRFVKMLEMTALELEEDVERELEENPALEPMEREEVGKDRDDTPYYLRKGSNWRGEADIPDFSPADTGETLYDSLRRQISERKVDPKVASIAKYMVGNIDENGYIDRSLAHIVDDLEFNQGERVTIGEAESALRLIQSLEPAGVGARDLQETLRLQIERQSPSEDRENAIKIVDTKFPEFIKKHYHKIQSSLGLTTEQTRKAVELISRLNPKPGASYGGATELGNIIIPDFIVENNNGELTVSLNNRIPELEISQSFREAVKDLGRSATKRESRKGKEFFVSRYEDAREYINTLKKRQETMMQVMTAILKIQREYFETEDVSRMKPMMLKDIEKITGLDKSTISRSTNNKFVATPWGILPLRHFFSDTIGDNEDVLTNRRIESEIKQLVESEDKRHPLSDEKLCSALQEEGFNVSRRTVAKYRDRIGIPVARLRKETI